MKREEQDKLWAELTPEQQNEHKESYRAFLEAAKSETLRTTFQWGYVEGKINTLISLFGEHNLQPSLTYKEMARELFGENNEKQEGTFCCPVFSENHCDKISAINSLICVAKFLNKNEDGSDWVPDFYDANQRKWYLYIDYTSDKKGKIKTSWKTNTQSGIVYFRTEAIAEQAIQILGEDVVRTALTTEY